MSSRRHSLSWSVAVLLAFAATAASAESPEPNVAVASAAECSQSVQSDPEFSEGDLSGLACVSVRCSSDQDCRNACPTARTATCSFNACHYTYSGGGGGGGGGPTCPLTKCSDDADCVCRGVQGYCANRACAY